jgi:hypothetical protein
MAPKVSQDCMISHNATQPAHRRRLCHADYPVCLRETVFPLPPTPGSKTDQRHKPRAEQNHRTR